MLTSDGYRVKGRSILHKNMKTRFSSIDKLIIAVKIKEPEAPIVSTTWTLESDTLLSNTYTIIIRGN